MTVIEKMNPIKDHHAKIQGLVRNTRSKELRATSLLKNIIHWQILKTANKTVRWLFPEERGRSKAYQARENAWMQHSTKIYILSVGT